MAFNLENMTISYKQMLRMAPSDRAALAEGSMGNDLISSLTPGQLASLFPSYYRDKLPDIGQAVGSLGGALSDPSRYVNNGGGGGGNDGAAPYTPPELTTEQQAEILAKAGIDVNSLIGSIGPQGLPADDERVKAVKNLSDEEMVKSGLERIKTEDGKTVIRQMTPEAQNLSDQEVLSRASGKVAQGTGNLEGTKKLQKQVYDSFVNAGFSDNQAKALTAEVGRENAYQDKYVFGKHVDANNSKVNLGFFSWQGSRGEELLERLKSKNLLDKNGAVIKSQESLNEMAAFAKHEMESSSEYKRTKKQFLDNPNITQEEAAEVLGNNFIRWDMAGRKIDPRPHMRRRDEYYDQIEAINKDFPGLVPENATPDQIAKAREDLIKQEKTQEAAALTQILYKVQEKQTQVSQGESLGKFEQEGSKDQFGITGTASQRGLEQVDPRLVDIMKKATEEFPLRARLFSGKRDEGAHGKGLATDMEIFDESGKPLGSYKSPQTANVYAMFALKAREIQMRDYPELANDFVWGGAFPGMVKGGESGGKYGAADFMDFRIGHSPQSAMQAFKWPSENDPGGWQPGYEQYTEGDFLGIGHRTPTTEDFKKLQGFKLTKEQDAIQKQIALSGGYNAGLLGHENIGERQPSQIATYIPPQTDNIPSSVPETQTMAQSTVPTPANADPVTSALSRVEGQPSEAITVPVSPVDPSPIDPAKLQQQPDTKQTTSAVQPPVADTQQTKVVTPPTVGIAATQPTVPTSSPANSDPVTLALSRVEKQPSEAIRVPVSPVDPSPIVVPAVEKPNVRSYASGGIVPMPPGENVAGINTDTGKLEFMSNDRELYTKDDNGNLRIDPSTIRQEEQNTQMAPPEPQRQEEPNQSMQPRPQQPMPVNTPDPDFLETMSSGSMASSPSQLRALNRARLYSENSSSLINGHFS